jgi:hypothetical protein
MTLSPVPSTDNRKLLDRLRDRTVSRLRFSRSAFAGGAVAFAEIPLPLALAAESSAAAEAISGLSFHTFLRIPVPAQLADVDDLAGVIGVVGADLGDGRIPFRQLRFIRVLDGLLPGL